LGQLVCPLAARTFKSGLQRWTLFSPGTHYKCGSTLYAFLSFHVAFTVRLLCSGFYGEDAICDTGPSGQKIRRFTGASVRFGGFSKRVYVGVVNTSYRFFRCLSSSPVAFLVFVGRRQPDISFITPNMALCAAVLRM